MANRLFPVNAVSGAPAYDGRALRQTGAASLAGATAARPLGARSGVRHGSDVIVTASSTTWTVSPHAGVLDLQASAAAGPYQYSVDSNVTGSVTAADGSNPRVDIVWVRADDPAESDGSSTPAVVFGYTAGTAAASPSAPATPARSMVLAQINVPKSGGGSPTVSNIYPSLPAYTIPVRTQAERDAIPSPASGLRVYRLDRNYTETWTGASWTPDVSVWAGGDNMLVGSSPSAGVRKVSTGRKTIVLTTNAAGGWAISLGSLFTGGYVGGAPTAGDTASNLGFTVIKLSNCTLGSFQGIAYTTSGSPVASSSIRLCYDLEGW